jgi:hypothetical protein
MAEGLLMSELSKFNVGDQVTLLYRAAIMRGPRAIGARIVPIPVHVVGLSRDSWRVWRYTVEILEKAGGFPAKHLLYGIVEQELTRTQ